MQDSAAEINLNEDLVLSRRWRQLKLIVLQEEQAHGSGARARSRSMDNYSSQPGLTALHSYVQQQLI